VSLLHSTDKGERWSERIFVVIPYYSRNPADRIGSRGSPAGAHAAEPQWVARPVVGDQHHRIAVGVVKTSLTSWRDTKSSCFCRSNPPRR
jgi:hypothetical protein